MNANEIMAECQKNTEEVFKACNGLVDRMLQLMQYGAQMQIAAQLAELNNRLENLSSHIGNGQRELRVTGNHG